MVIEELRDSVRSIPGVASAEVLIGPDEEPLVRVWTDGTRPDEDVQSAVEIAVASNAPDVEQGDRLGRGRDPDGLSSEASREWNPARLNAAIEVASPTGRLKGRRLNTVGSNLPPCRSRACSTGRTG